MKKFRQLITGALLIASSSFAQHEGFADSIRWASHIPELSYAVIDSTGILELKALGFHTVDKKDTATLDDRFHIGSNTKAMTAFIVAKYVEKKKLQWTTKFFDVYPAWKSKAKAGYYNMTLAGLLSHTAGVQPFQGENDPVVPGFKGTVQQKRAAFGRFVLALEPVKGEGGSAFVYSNAGYTLATLMLEKVTNKSWEQLVDEVFNRDLHLNIKLSWPENQRNKDTWGHFTKGDKLIPVRSDTSYRLDYTEPAGDINITLPDYLTFIRLNLSGLEGKKNYLTPDTYRFIHDGIKDYAIGWYNIREGGEEWSTHSGTAGTYFTVVHINRHRKTAYVIFTNAFSDAVINGVRLLMRKLKEQYGG